MDGSHRYGARALNGSAFGSHKLASTTTGKKSHMPGLSDSYKKWDNFEDSDEEEEKFSGGRIVPKPAPVQQQPDEGKQTAKVAAGFIVKTTAQNRQRTYINVCSSTSVPTSMTALPSQTKTKSLDATLPYIVGDAREDEDKEGKCLVIECLFHPDTMAKYEEDKLMAETIITTALSVVHELAIPLESKSAWSLFEADELRERNGAFFFPPGKLRNQTADGDLGGVE